ncbi:hypothetical protein Barb6_01982 [Bacteroidales bacterium Barb6]|nr:hypothetical protein Barb6_01982 [Bacteroidales bacterium Barb6]
MTFAHILIQKDMGTFKYKEQYGVIVICRDENEQREIYDSLLKKGLTLKVVTV